MLQSLKPKAVLARSMWNGSPKLNLYSLGACLKILSGEPHLPLVRALASIVEAFLFSGLHGFWSGVGGRGHLPSSQISRINPGTNGGDRFATGWVSHPLHKVSAPPLSHPSSP